MKKHRLVASTAFLLTCMCSHAQVVVVAGARSPAATLTADQASSLFLGKSEKLPGAGNVVLIDQGESKPVREQFYNKVVGKTPAQVKATWARLLFSGKALPPKEALSSAEVKKLVAANPDAIGYIEKGEVDSSVKVLLSMD